MAAKGLDVEQQLGKNARLHYSTVVSVFCGLLLLSNILAVKPIAVGNSNAIISLGPVQILPLVFDGGAILFPMTYILGDVLSEIYGFKKARKAIMTGFALQLVATLMIGIVGVLPSVPSWENNQAFNDVLGFVPRIAAASLCAYLVGELLNSVVLIKIREKTGEKKLWIRLIGSTLVGEIFDTVTFCTIAFLGVISLGEFLNYVVVGYLFKCLLEVVLLPVTYRVVMWLKR
jgi:uncharacterized integral membrane protein (TIGR00697 family)